MSIAKKVLGAAAGTSLIIGAIGGTMIQVAEGKKNRAYRDPVGIVTICYGHTGPDVKMGMVWSDEKCEAVFLEDVKKHQAPITPGNRQNCIGNRQLTYNQRDAVTSFIFNVGNGKFCSSTMAKRLKVGDFPGAAAQFPKWKYAGGRVLRGLVTRRAKEQALFNSTAAWQPYVLKQTVTYN